jgi:hypothetical protein
VAADHTLAIRPSARLAELVQAVHLRSRSPRLSPATVKCRQGALFTKVNFRYCQWTQLQDMWSTRPSRHRWCRASPGHPRVTARVSARGIPSSLSRAYRQCLRPDPPWRGRELSTEVTANLCHLVALPTGRELRERGWLVLADDRSTCWPRRRNQPPRGTHPTAAWLPPKKVLPRHPRRQRVAVKGSYGLCVPAAERYGMTQSLLPSRPCPWAGVIDSGGCEPVTRVAVTRGLFWWHRVLGPVRGFGGFREPRWAVATGRTPGHRVRDQHQDRRTRHSAARSGAAPPPPRPV